MEQTFVMLKPDAVQRSLIGPITTRFEALGLKFVAMKLMYVSTELAAKHYEEHLGKPFYPGLIQFITSGPVVATVIEGPNAVAVVRKVLGATRPVEASPGTIRGDFGLTVGRNLVHASDKRETAAREITLYFAPEEILSYERATDRWILE